MFRVFCRHCQKTDSECLICQIASWNGCVGMHYWVQAEGSDFPIHFGKEYPMRLEDLPSSEQEDIFMCVMLKQIA